MANDTVHVIARLSAVAPMRERLRRVLLALVVETRREAGCVRYDLIQSEDEPDTFVFEEEWESAAAFDTHLQTPHFQEAARALDGLVTQLPDVRRYHAVSRPSERTRGSST